MSQTFLRNKVNEWGLYSSDQRRNIIFVTHMDHRNVKNIFHRGTVRFDQPEKRERHSSGYTSKMAFR